MDDTDKKLAMLAREVNNFIWCGSGSLHDLFHTTVEVVGLVPGRDGRYTVHKVVYKNVTFLTQNPNKGSRFAQMARDGSKIVWGIIREETGQETWKIRVIDGEVEIKDSRGEWHRT
jgi:hypothetical protein